MAFKNEDWIPPTISSRKTFAQILTISEKDDLLVFDLPTLNKLLKVAVGCYENIEN